MLKSDWFDYVGFCENIDKKNVGSVMIHLLRLNWICDVKDRFHLFLATCVLSTSEWIFITTKLIGVLRRSAFSVTL